MNRDEALDKIINGSTRENVQVKLINKIYDDFESRTCSSCKHGTDKNIGIDCNLEVQENSKPMYMGLEHINNSDFGCIKWESKDD